jgi:tocopherol cyclase
VLSLDHSLHGTFTVDGQDINWNGGRGYIEKDWGTSFPSAWVWFQTNHFARPGISLTASVAIIPWLQSSFRGFIIGLWHEGQLYRFATYTGAQLEHLELTAERVLWTVSDRAHRLEMSAMRASGGLIRGPSKADMGVRVPETLSAVIEVRLARLGRARDEVILADTGRYGGLEVVGHVERLLS